MPSTKNVHKQRGKGINYREIGDKFGVSASTACKKVNTEGTDENLFRLVPMPGHGARVLPLELMPVPGHGTLSTTEGYVQTRTRAQASRAGTKSERGLTPHNETLSLFFLFFQSMHTDDGTEIPKRLVFYHNCFCFHTTRFHNLFNVVAS